MKTLMHFAVPAALAGWLMTGCLGQKENLASGSEKAQRGPIRSPAASLKIRSKIRCKEVNGRPLKLSAILCFLL